jgi:hypothetical protein
MYGTITLQGINNKKIVFNVINILWQATVIVEIRTSLGHYGK